MSERQAPPSSAALWASWRQGLNEVSTALSKPFPDSIQVDQAGVFGNPTPWQVTQEQQPDLVRSKQVEMNSAQAAQERGKAQDLSR